VLLLLICFYCFYFSFFFFAFIHCMLYELRSPRTRWIELNYLELLCSNAEVERGFSVLKTIKTKLRNKLGIGTKLKKNYLTFVNFQKGESFSYSSKQEELFLSPQLSYQNRISLSLFSIFSLSFSYDRETDWEEKCTYRYFFFKPFRSYFTSLSLNNPYSQFREWEKNKDYENT